MDAKIKEIGIRASIILNIFFFILIFWGLFGGASKILENSFISPIYIRDVSQFELLEIQQGDIVFLGDSITEGGEWNELFLQNNIKNRGVIGDDTRGVLARLEQITKGNPSQIFLMVGINDILANTPQEEVVSNIINIVDKIIQDSPDTEIFVQSILPNKKNFKSKIESVNLRLEAELSDKVHWIDLYPLFLNKEGFINNSLSNDNLHLLGEGYILWRDTIKNLVNQESL